MVFSRVSCIWNGNWAIVPFARAHLRKPESHLSLHPVWISSLPLSLLDVEAWRGGLVSSWSVWRAGPSQVHLPFLSLLLGRGREGGARSPRGRFRELSEPLEVSLKGRQPVLIAAQVNFLSSPQSVRQPLPRSLPSGFMRSEACWGALTFSQAPPQGSFPDCGKRWCPGALRFLLTSSLPPLSAPPDSPRPCPLPPGKSGPHLRTSTTQAIPEGTFTSMKILSQPPKPDSDRSFQPEIRLLFSRCRAWQKKVSFLLKTKRIKLSAGAVEGTMETWRFLSVPRGIYGESGGQRSDIPGVL